MAKTTTQTPYPFIIIENDAGLNPYFPSTAVEALAMIAGKPVGKSLLDAISNSAIDGSAGFKVKLIRGAGTTAQIGKPGEEGGSRPLQ